MTWPVFIALVVLLLSAFVTVIGLALMNDDGTWDRDDKEGM